MNPTPEELAGLIAHGVNAALKSRLPAAVDLTPERLAELVNAGIHKATAGLVANVKSQQTENEALRRRLDALEAEVVRMQAKSAGGMLTLAARR